jgi:undecaprenyl-diphosphatase
MLEAINSFDENLFLFFNGLHSPVIDPVMWLFSSKFFWIPLYIWFLWLLYKRYPKHYWTVLVSVALMIVVSDQLCNLAKDGFMRLRPSHEPHLRTLVHVLKYSNGNEYRGGMYGFYSGHSSNAFAVALFLITALFRNSKYIIPIALIFAVLTAYSRVYLGVHYTGDILVGAIMGSLLGIGFAVLHEKLRENLRI